MKGNISIINLKYFFYNIVSAKAVSSKTVTLLLIFLLQSCGSDKVDNTVYSVTANLSNADFSNEFLQVSTESVAINVNFNGEGLLVGFASDAEDSRWLTYRAEDVTPTSATIYIDVINGERLPVDLYKTKLRLTTTSKDASKFASYDIDVSLLIWDIAINTDQVNFSATLGDASAEIQKIEIATTSDWTVTTDDTWLSFDVSAGSGNGVINVSATTTQVLSAGLTNGTIIFTEVNSGDSKSIPVQLALDNIYLYADSPAIALSKTANINAIEQTITISNNSVNVINWQATTTAEWLTLTPVGDTQLKITANTNLAPINATSTATINIAAKDEADIIADDITVAFYHSDLTVENKLIEPLAIDSAMLSSPSLPTFYLAKENKLHTYHQYTAALEHSLDVSPEGTELTQLIMHPNGKYLLAKAIETITNSDDNTTTDVIHRYRINLWDNSIEKVENSNIDYEPLAIIRLSGRYFVLTETLEFADENLQRLYWDGVNAYFTNKISMAATAGSLFALDIFNATFKRYTAQINDFGENSILPKLTHSYRPELLGETQLINDFIVSNNEASIYAISETSEWISFDGTTFTDNGLLDTNENVATLFLVSSLDEHNNSRANYLKIDPTQADGFYLATYDQQQALLSTVFTEGNQPSSILLSADNQRLIINTNTPSTAEVNARIELLTLSQQEIVEP